MTQRRVRDSFWQWNLLHKSVVAFLFAVFVSLVVHAIRVYDAAFDLQEEMVIQSNTADLWPWMITNENRARWQAGLIDLSHLTGKIEEAGSTRLLFWRHRGKRWQALEQTNEVVIERLFTSIQESDIDQRWFRLELTPEGPCRTKVRINEVIHPLFYKERFWFFLEHDDHQKRLTTSLKALNRWMVSMDKTCNPPN